MKWAGLDRYGIVVMTGECPMIDDKTIFPSGLDKVIIDPPDGVVHSRWFHDGQSFEMLPDRPSEHHVLDRETRSWVLDLEACAKAARDKRNALLKETDWVMLPDVLLSSDVLAEYRTYRQALRDLPQQSGFPENITWPNLPQ